MCAGENKIAYLRRRRPRALTCAVKKKKKKKKKKKRKKFRWRRREMQRWRRQPFCGVSCMLCRIQNKLSNIVDEYLPHRKPRPLICAVKKKKKKKRKKFRWCRREMQRWRRQPLFVV